MILSGLIVWKWSCGGAVSVTRSGRRRHVQRHGATAGLWGHGAQADRLPEKAQHDLREARWVPNNTTTLHFRHHQTQINIFQRQSFCVTLKYCSQNRRSMFTKMGGGVCKYVVADDQPMDPYVSIDADEHHLDRSTTKPKTFDPVWNETFSHEVHNVTRYVYT